MARHAETAASIAFPPCLRISNPAEVANWFLVATITLSEIASDFVIDI